MMREKRTEVLVVGGGLGGVAAALAACKLGSSVVLTEETDWLGGQLTAQGVPPDEHPWIAQTGCTKTYRLLRERIRDYYRRNYPLKPGVRESMLWNPGRGRVSPLCAEPRVAVAAIDELLAPHRSRGRVAVLLRHRPISATTDGDKVTSVVLADRDGNRVEIHARYIIDATELGDLLPMTGTEHVVGAESRDQTGEPHAVESGANPSDQQAVSWCFALDFHPGEDHTIERPRRYGYFRNYEADFWPGKLLSWTDVHPRTLETRHRTIFGDPPSVGELGGNGLWHYRRIFFQGDYEEGAFPSDITLVNWPQIDYWISPLLGVSDGERAEALEGARELSYSFLYWMQTEAPRPDGGIGYPGLRLRGDVLGTTDGLAKAPYVRESRRLIAEFSPLEQHVGVEARGSLVGAEQYSDSVGVGSYRIDLHPSTAGRTYVDIDTWPFQIPLGSLIPVRVENLLPACKNIGTTHVTNGCYRLHPIEWNIGEAAGALASFCLTRKTSPRGVRNSDGLLADYRRVLFNELGIDLEWPEYARTTPRLGSENRWAMRDQQRI